MGGSVPPSRTTLNSTDRPTKFLFSFEEFFEAEPVSSLTSFELGPYVRLLRRAWHATPPATLPSDDRVLARWAEINSAEWAEAKTAVLACFTTDGSGRLVSTWLQARYDVAQQRRREAIARAQRARTARETSAQPSMSNPSPAPGLEVWRGREHHIPAILALFPAHARGRGLKAQEAVRIALERIHARGEGDAFAWLSGRVRAYTASPQGQRGGFTVSATNWFLDGCYDDPPEAWEAKGDAPVPKFDAAKAAGVKP